MSPTSRDLLRCPKPEIKKIWGLLGNRLNDVLPKVGKGYWIHGKLEKGVYGDLKSTRYINEEAIRERGSTVPVVPLIVNRDRTISYWISLHQRWDEPTDLRSKKNPLFVYRTTGVTVFFGQEHNEEKAQVFRAEWPGLRQKRDNSVEFEAQGAGHPHWQFDAYQHHLQERKEERQRRDDFGRLLSEGYPEAIDFTEEVHPGAPSDRESELVAHMKRLTRMHFASSTRWAENPWNGDVSNVESHAQSPSNLEEVMNWTISTIRYVLREVDR